jgi:hypothetical protein
LVVAIYLAREATLRLMNALVGEVGHNRKVQENRFGAKPRLCPGNDGSKEQRSSRVSDSSAKVNR